MSITGALPSLETWLQEHCDSWKALEDREYRELVRGWSRIYRPLIEVRARKRTSSRALAFLESQFPASVFLFSGVHIAEVANLGGDGAAAYHAKQLGSLDSSLARQLELIVLGEDMTWCCLFSHEAGALVHEEVYQTGG